MPVCNPREYYECVLAAQANYVKNNEAAKCNCPRQCRTLTYQPTVSQAQLAVAAGTFMKNKLNLNASVNDIIRDYCIVEVRKEMNFTCSHKITGLQLKHYTTYTITSNH